MTNIIHFMNPNANEYISHEPLTPNENFNRETTEKYYLNTRKMSKDQYRGLQNLARSIASSANHHNMVSDPLGLLHRPTYTSI